MSKPDIVIELPKPMVRGLNLAPFFTIAWNHSN